MTSKSQPAVQASSIGVIGANVLTYDELIVTRQGERPEFIPLDTEKLLIGRGSDCVVKLKGKAVSRNHAKLEKLDDGWHVTDLGSTNGTYVNARRVLRNKPQFWKSGVPIQIGAYTLHWQPATNNQEGTLVLASGDVPVEEIAGTTSDNDLEFSVEQENLEVKPGEEGTVVIELTNSGDEIKSLQVKMDGLAANWYSLSQAVLIVEPDATQTVTLTVDLKEQQQVRGGDHAFNITFMDANDPLVSTPVPCMLHVPALPSFEMRVSTDAVANPNGKINVNLVNNGNVSDWYVVKPTKVPRGIQFKKPEWDTALLPDSNGMVACEFSAESRPLFGKPKAHTITIRTESSLGQVKEEDTTIMVAPRFSFSSTAAIFSVFATAATVATMAMF